MPLSALLIEDQASWQDILSRELLQRGIRVDWAADLGQAMRKIKEPLFVYDLVILDPHLNDETHPTEGLAIVQLLQDLDFQGVLVLVSGLLSEVQTRQIFSQFDHMIVGIFEKSTFARSALETILETMDVSDSAAVGPIQPGSLFNPNYDQLERRWDRVQHAQASYEKGLSLELFGIDLLSSIPLLQFVRQRSLGRTQEIDLVFQVAPIDGTIFKDWGTLLLVECKNREVPFSSSDVAGFGARLRKVRCIAGVIISLGGIAGSEERSARLAVREQHMEDKQIIVVLDRADCEGIVRRRLNLYKLLYERHFDIRLGR